MRGYGAAAAAGSATGRPGRLADLDAHAAALERAMGVIFTVFALGQVGQFWLVLTANGCSAPAAVGGGAVLTAVMAALVAGVLLHRERRRLLGTVAGTAVAACAWWSIGGLPPECGTALAAGAYLLCGPACVGWAALSPRIPVVGGVLLTAVLVLPAARLSRSLALEEFLFAGASVVLAAAAADVLRRTAAAADA